MKGGKHSPEQIIRKLREADRMLAEGKSNAEIAKALEVTEWTMSRWRNQYGGLKGDDAKRLKELEKENSRLKRIVADQTLDIDMLKEIALENSEPDAPARRSGAPDGALQRVGEAGLQGGRAASVHTATDSPRRSTRTWPSGRGCGRSRHPFLASASAGSAPSSATKATA